MTRLGKVATIGVTSIAALTLALGLYCARPWEANDSGQDRADYIVLCGLVTWSISPHIVMIGFIWFLRNRPGIQVGFCIGVFVIAVLGLCMLVYAMFIHLDAQSGLVFIFAPLYQLLATLLLSIISLFIRLGHRAWRSFSQMTYDPARARNN